MDVDGSDLLDESSEGITHTDAKFIINGLVEKNQKYSEVLKNFNLELSDDVKVLQSYYTESLLKTLPFKGRQYIQRIFDSLDHEIIVKWMDVVFNSKPNKELEKLLTDAPFYECMKDLRDVSDEIEFSTFFVSLRKEFSAVFSNFQGLHGIVEIYRCLIRCQSQSHSQVYCNAVKALWKILGFQNDVLDLEPKKGAQDQIEHLRLAKLVNDFDGSGTDLVGNLIKNLFQATHFKYDENQATLKISGYKIILSKILEKLVENHQIKSVQIQALNEFVIDQNLDLQGITLSIAANKIVIPKTVTISLSGSDAVSSDSMKIRANDGKELGENGMDGKDGKAGESSGNFAIRANVLYGKENLTLILNGGNGALGQSGGNGADGKDGVGRKFNDVFTNMYAFQKSAKHLVNCISMGSYSRIFDGKSEKKRADGQIEELRSDSAYYIFSTHSVDFCLGFDGGAGGKAGKNGLGGEGGKKGTVDIKIGAKNKSDSFSFEANDGKKGANGHPGKNGDPGREGWDIAVIKKSISGQQSLGESENKKLTIEYKEIETPNSIYIQDEAKGPQSKCYLEIGTRECAKRILTDSEKMGEEKQESERSGEAVAVEAATADTASLSQDYQEILLSSESNEVQQQTSVIASNEIQNVTRIMEFWTDLEEIPYLPKTKQKAPEFRESDLKGVDFNSDNTNQFWEKVPVFSLEDLLEKYEEGSQIHQKLAKKNMLFELRASRTKIETAPMIEEMLVQPEAILSINENIGPFIELFNKLKKMEIDNKLVEYYICEIEQAFSQKNSANLKKCMKKTSLPDFTEALHSPIFASVTTEYANLSDTVKEDFNSLPLFFFWRLYGSIAINYVFFREIEEGEFNNKSIAAFMILQNRRLTQSLKFVRELKKLEENCNVQIPITDVEQSLQSKLDTLFEMLDNQDDTVFLRKEIEFLCKNFPATGITFVNSLLLVFEVEGCHTDIDVLKYLTDTIFEACSRYGFMNCFIFPSILLITEQEQWIDQFFVFNVETMMKEHISRKADMLNALKQFKDENLKFLCTQKLAEFPDNFSGESLCNLLEEIKDSDTLFPHLENIDMISWKDIMAKVNFHQNVNSSRFNVLKKYQKNLVIFWCTKLMDCFDSTDVQEAIDLIIDFLIYDKNVVGRFMHRLCDAGNVVNATTHPLKNILKASLHCLKSSVAMENNTECYKIAKELLISYNSVTPRKLDEIKTLCQNLNVGDSTIDSVLTLLECHLSAEDEQRIYSCALSIKLNIVPASRINTQKYKQTDEIALNYHGITRQGQSEFDNYQERSKFQNIQLHLKEQFSECSHEDINLFYLLIIDQIIRLQQKFNLRHTQKIAILCALQEFDENKQANGILQQISTGEGKTLIIAVLGIINALQNHNVNIITSSNVLAKRDVVNPVCVQLYEAFGLQVDHICYDCPQRRQNIYSKCHIIFGDLTSYQRDFLMDKFYSTRIGKGRKMDIVIVDEVDSLLLDNGLNTLYLSHNIADFEMLHSLIIQIWNLVNLQLKSDESCKTESFFQTVHSLIFPVFSWTDFSDVLSEIEISNLREIMISNGVIDKEDNIITTKRKDLWNILDTLKNNFEKCQTFFLTKYCPSQITANLAKECSLTPENFEVPEKEGKHFIEMLKQRQVIDANNQIIMRTTSLQKKLDEMKKDFSEFINSHFVQKYNEIMDSIVVDIPAHLRQYVVTHLKEFIANAEIAANMEVDVAYRIGMSNSLNEVSEPKIVIIDQDTGVDLPTTQWHKGLHQFLQLKHGLRLTALSTKAVFISNISFLQKFKGLYGFSGTLGIEGEKKQLHEFYKLKSIVLPSSNVKQFYEECSIITQTKERQYKEIFEAIKEKMDEGRSVLVIGESCKQVVEISDNISQIAHTNVPAEEQRPYSNAIIYKHDSDNFQYGDGKTELDQQALIFATNLAGRGTDILLTEELKAQGGLHVIIAFLPRNVRIEEQAFGRSARCGECGTAQLIICDETIKNESCARITELKWKRNAVEDRRIRSIRQRYENRLKVEENCFSKFVTVFQQFTGDNSSENPLMKIFFKDMLDQWALFLDDSEYGTQKREDATEDFCQKVLINRNIKPILPLNLLNYAIAMLNDGNYRDARGILNDVCEKFPAYLPEALYYLVFIAAKDKNKKQQFANTQKKLYDARNGFLNRLLNCEKNIEIVDTHKIIEENRVFQCDTFVQQQKESFRFINRIIETIDAFFGQRIEPTIFTSDILSEEASMFLFKYFSTSEIYATKKPITGLRIKMNVDDQIIRDYCKLNGLLFTSVSGSLKSFQDSEEVTLKNLHDVMDLATWKDFWDELDEKGFFTDVKEHIFIDFIRLPPMTASILQKSSFEKIIKNDEEKSVPDKILFQHFHVVTEKWKEVNLNEIERTFTTEFIEILIENQIICKTKSGILSDRFSESMNINFKNFDTITVDDFISYDIPEKEAEKIVRELVDAEILKQNSATEYGLPTFIEIDKPTTFAFWYGNTVMKIIKQKLAFAIAYQALKRHSWTQKPLSLFFYFKHIPYFVDSDEKFIKDLINYDILEKSNINLGGLLDIVGDAHDVRQQWETVCAGEADYNIRKALEKARIFIKNNFGEEPARLLDGVIHKPIPNPIVNGIIAVFYENAAVNQKYDTFDIELIPINESYLNKIENNHLLITHGLTHLIIFKEEIFKAESISKSSAITLFGLAQVGVGVLIQTGGTNGQYLTFEGISDVQFGLNGMIKGRSGDYKKHKIRSIVTNASLWGTTEGARFAKDIPFIRSLIGNLSVEKVVKEVSKWVEEDKHEEDLIKKLRKATNFAINEISLKLRAILNTTFKNPEYLKKLDEMATIFLQQFQDKKQKLNNVEILQHFINPMLYDISYFMLAELRTSFLENKEIDKEKSFETRIVSILKSKNFQQVMEKLSKKIQSSIDEFHTRLGLRFQGASALNSKTDDRMKSEFIENWKKEIGNKSQNILKEKLKIPANYSNETEYQRQLESIVRSAHSELRRNPKAMFDEEIYELREADDGHSKIMIMELKRNFYTRMAQLQLMTRNPELYCAAFLTSLHIDDFGAEICSQMLYHITSNFIIVRNGDGLHKSAHEIIIESNIDNGDEKSVDALYTQLCSQIPEFKMHFETKDVFEASLLDEISKNPNFFSRHSYSCQIPEI